MSEQCVFFVIPNMNAGGAERVALTLLQHLDRRDFSYTLVVLDDGNGAFIDRIPDDVRLITLGKKRVRAALFALIQLVWKERPALIFSNLSHLNLMLSMFRFLFPGDVKFIARESSIVSVNMRQFPIWKLWQKLYKGFYSRHDTIICQSEFMRNDLLKNFGIRSDKSIVINNPVDISRIRKMASITNGEKTQIKSEKWHFVAVGRLSAEKGVDNLLNALALMRRDDINVDIIGDGPLANTLQTQANNLGLDDRVNFKGFVSNPYGHIIQADALLLTSHYEGFPNVVLEALALNTPVIATPAIGGLAEIIDGINACVIADGFTAKNIAVAIEDWINIQPKSIDEDVTSKYDANIIAQQYENEFRKVLACD